MGDEMGEDEVGELRDEMILDFRIHDRENAATSIKSKIVGKIRERNSRSISASADIALN